MPNPRPIRVTSVIKPTSAVHTLFDETQALAKREGKTPVLTLAEKGKPGFIIVVDPADLVELLREFTAANPPAEESA